MNKPLEKREWPRVGTVVEAYEAALARDDGAALADFAPHPEHPDRLAILCELIRVDLEHRWACGQPPRLEDYREHFPAVFEDSQLLHAMAYEEYRLRQQAGEWPTPAEYQRRFGLKHAEWPPSDLAVRRASEGELSPGPKTPADDSGGMDRAAMAYRAYRREGTQGPDKLDLAFDTHHVPPEQADLLRSLDRTDPHAAERLAAGLSGLPVVGADFLGFRLCGELGRGAFGRVFLARQGDLADRLVALKVSADVVGEMHALAQLQHTNIVSIYSVHRRGPLQAVCMPYLGATTLADTLSSLRSQAELPKSGEGLLSTLRSRSGAKVSSPSESEKAPTTDEKPVRDASDAPRGPLDGLSRVLDQAAPAQIERLRGMGYVQAVLWLMERVAEGLAHAHERGILHRDLKPANILFADDGEPVLLDFNLAADTKARFGASVALVGGTLPYMAPEHLAAFHEARQSVDARSDIYALGVILYELLTGAAPFPVLDGLVDVILPKMIADRRGPLPDVRRANASVSPAVAAIVRHCLEPDPSRRYQTARELQEDLKRQLDHLPLRYTPEPSVRERASKWARRHPRLTSSTTVGLVAALLLSVVGSVLFVQRRQIQQAAAADASSLLENEREQAVALLMTPELDPIVVEEGIALCRRAANRYGVLEDSSWLDRPLAIALPAVGRAQVRQHLGEVLVIWARALTWRATTRKGQQRVDDLGAAAMRLDRAESCFGPETRPRALLLARANLVRLTGGGSDSELELRARAESMPLRSDRNGLLIEDPEPLKPDLLRQLSADMRVTAQRDPRNWSVWVALGHWNGRLRRLAEAKAAYSVAVALAPGPYRPLYDRGMLNLELKDYSQALEDFDQVIAKRPDLARAYLNRALAKLGLGDVKGAIDDLTFCLTLKGAPSRAWFVRAKARQRLGDLAGARLDREEGMKHEPDEPDGFVARGLARLPADPNGALADFDSALAIDPFHREALQDKAAVLGENLGRGEDALKVLDTLLLHHPENFEAYCGRGVQLARFGRRDEALRDARAALAIDNGAQTIYQVACIYALASRKEPTHYREALQFLAQAFRQNESWLAIAREDPDIAPIRARPEFQKLLQAFQVVIRAGQN